ncbi:glycosyltransferase [Leifsonia naganoensis]|uniref:glycosyltransferase n=1 Tax=Leifsonia naganoensis TaxID=150025 RepID=UPI0031B60798
MGAAAFRLRALARGLAAEGARVRVVTTIPPRGTPSTSPDAGVAVARFPVLRDRGGNVRGYVQYLSFDVPLAVRLLFTGGDLVVSEPPPTTGIVVALTSMIRRRPYAYYAADVWSDGLVALGAPRALVSVMKGIESFVLRHAATVIAVSEEVAQKVVDFGVARSAVATVDNGVDTEVFTPDGPVAPGARPAFVYTGSMSEWQAPAIFVEALAIVRQRFPEASIRFFGQGVEESHVSEAAARLGLADAVHLGGVIPPAETAEWIRGATAALASIRPGIGYDFAKPTKTYAAAACGTPVVFAGRGAGAALVERNDLGWRSDFTPEAVAQAMIAAAEADGGADHARRRVSRVEWVRQHASLAAAGQRAARRLLASE